MRSFGTLVFLVWLVSYAVYLWHQNAGRWNRAQRFLDVSVAMIAIGAVLMLLCGSIVMAIINGAILVYVLRGYPRTDGRAWLERTMPGVARTIFWGKPKPAQPCRTGTCGRPRGRTW
ncbi:hypothetical protein HY480_03220 [Candidatus Uhrbacteria bacterium]|nr:hypothetical protein [Candidatus Uhrbacteria bacterium]